MAYCRQPVRQVTYTVHGIVRHEVARAFIKEYDPVFCHRYPTRPCAVGNYGVRSVWDTVASVSQRAGEPRGESVTVSLKTVGSWGWRARST